MELQEALKKRRSVRRFTEESVSEQELNLLLHAAMSGPSACNTQPWVFYVVHSKDVLLNLQKSSPFTKINAPLAIVVAGNKRQMLPFKSADFWIQDTSAATENILLCATDLGLGAVWCGIYPNESSVEKVRKTLSMPDYMIPLNIIYIGHPDEEKEARDQFDPKKVHII